MLWNPLVFPHWTLEVQAYVSMVVIGCVLFQTNRTPVETTAWCTIITSQCLSHTCTTYKPALCSGFPRFTGISHMAGRWHVNTTSWETQCMYLHMETIQHIRGLQMPNCYTRSLTHTCCVVTCNIDTRCSDLLQWTQAVHGWLSCCLRGGSTYLWGQVCLSRSMCILSLELHN